MSEPFAVLQIVSEDSYLPYNLPDNPITRTIRETTVCVDPEPSQCRPDRTITPFSRAEALMHVGEKDGLSLLTIGFWLAGVDVQAHETEQDRFDALGNISYGLTTNRAWAFVLQRLGIETIVNAAWAKIDKVYNDSGAPDQGGRFPSTQSSSTSCRPTPSRRT